MYEAKEIRKKMMATYQRWFGTKPRLYSSPLNLTKLRAIRSIRDQGLPINDSDRRMPWVIRLGRFDIAVHIMSLGSYIRATPRKGHLDCTKRVYRYLMKFKDGTIRIRTGLPDFSDLRYEKHDWSHSTICWSQGETFNCSSSKQIIRRSKYRIMEAEGSRSLINVAINGDVQQALTSQFELLNINNIKAHTLTLSRFIMDSQPYCLVLFAALMII